MDNVDRMWNVNVFVPDGLSLSVVAATEREAIESAQKRMKAVMSLSSSFTINSSDTDRTSYYATPLERF